MEPNRPIEDAFAEINALSGQQGSPRDLVAHPLVIKDIGSTGILGLDLICRISGLVSSAHCFSAAMTGLTGNPIRCSTCSAAAWSDLCPGSGADHQQVQVVAEVGLPRLDTALP